MNADEDELLSASAREPDAFEALVVAVSPHPRDCPARRAPQAADDLLAEVRLRAFAGRTGFDAARGTATSAEGRGSPADPGARMRAPAVDEPPPQPCPPAGPYAR
ncbi:hypothetical protein [Streptomyces sp. NPDC090112]|uniref:hypothetical protein n=1 Tax=Streptomyces sp. NPDC090112 TaxID=3365949 RepID=UPI0038077CCE